MKIIGYRVFDKFKPKEVLKGYPNLKEALKQEFNDDDYWIEVFGDREVKKPYVSFWHIGKKIKGGVAE